MIQTFSQTIEIPLPLLRRAMMHALLGKIFSDIQLMDKKIMGA